MTDKYKCRLVPYKIQNVLSLQEAQQKAGWNITAFDLPSAWKKSQGEGVVVGVIDTGICDHPDLRNNLLPGINFVQPGKPPIDENGHSTHVSGIICAMNNDIGVVGVAPKAKVRPIKALDKNGNGDLRNVAKGIRWAADNGCNLICMSLGAPVPVATVRKAIQYAQTKNVVCFVAAGNIGNTQEVFYPAAYPETIAIGAIDENFNRAKFSNTGPGLDFMCPGVNILSTVPPNWYALMSGTSQATPFATGLAALLLSYSKSSGKKIQLNNAQDYINIFKQHTTPVKSSNHGQFFEGFGIIEPKRFLEAVVSTK